ncbi:MAG: ABC-2 family transporter protein [Candidatus Marsarchaeota archaeon]|nr:ABC-2 family transporter protein [Candidatus Marsarchaeota archaeon]
MSNPYLAVLKIYIKEAIAYKADFALYTLFSMLRPLILIFVFYAVYQFSNVSTLNGITFSSIMIYFFVIGSMDFIATSNIAPHMQTSIRQGGITSELIRPVNYIFILFFSVISYDLLLFIFATIPILVLIYLIAGIHLSVFIIIAFAIGILIAYLISNLLSFIIGSFSVYFVDITGISDGSIWITEILGGGIIPIMLYPKIISSVLMLTPFPFMIFVPAGIFTGIINTNVVNVLIVGIVWVIILALISKVVWKRVSRDMNVVGV